MKFITKKIPIIKLREMHCLTEFELDKLSKSFSKIEPYFFCSLNDTIYHKKIINIQIAINELLGKLISEHFKDNQPKSKIIRNENNVYYLITKSFFQNGNLYTGFNNAIFPKIKYTENNRLPLNTLELLEEYQINNETIQMTKKDLERLKYKLKMMIINDFLRKQSDRWYNNFLIEYNKSHCKLMPLYDFEHSFFQFDEDLCNSFQFDLTDKNTINYIRNDEQFQELLNLAMELDMKKIYEKLFDKYPVRMTKEEKEQYESIIKGKQEEIKTYKLIKM